MERRRNQSSGFTLIEILVVVSIIGVLAGLVGVIIAKSNEKALKTSTIQLVQAYLPAKIKDFQGQMGGRLPASTLSGLQKMGTKVKPWKSVSMTNDINLCNEILIIQLRHPDFTNKLTDDDVQAISDPWGNLDDDTFSETPVGAKKGNEAIEVLDSWGTPVIYIHNADYDKTFLIRNFLGDDVEVSARQRPDGTFYNENGFQLISLGPDGVQGEEAISDDIQNFKMEGE